jgi:hypothetical protein
MMEDEDIPMAVEVYNDCILLLMDLYNNIDSTTQQEIQEAKPCGRIGCI